MHILSLLTGSSATGDFGSALFWTIVLFVLREAIAAAIVFVIAGSGFLIATAIDKIYPVVIGWLVAIVAVIVWEIFAIFWIIGDVVNLGRIAGWWS